MVMLPFVARQAAWVGDGFDWVAPCSFGGWLMSM
jgi:hypothetical protein